MSINPIISLVRDHMVLYLNAIQDNIIKFIGMQSKLSEFLSIVEV